MTMKTLVLLLDFSEAEKDVGKPVNISADDLCFFIEKMINEGWIRGMDSSIDAGIDPNPHVKFGADVTVQTLEEYHGDA